MIGLNTDGLGLPLEGPFTSEDFSMKFDVACVLNKIVIYFIRIHF